MAYVNLLFLLEKIDKIIVNRYNWWTLFIKYFGIMNKSEIIKNVASAFHEEWRKNRQMDNGKYKPMIEKSEDEERTIKHWTNVVDIANTNFEDLPSNRKYENLQAAKVAIDLVYDGILVWEKFTVEDIEKMSEVVHTEWLNGISPNDLRIKELIIRIFLKKKKRKIECRLNWQFKS